MNLVAIGSDRLVDRLESIGLGGSGLALEGNNRLLALVVGSALGLALLLELSNNILIFPANFVGDTANGGVLTTGLELQDAKSRGDKSSSTTGSLMSNHTAESLVEDAGRSTEMEGTTVGVDNAALVKVSMVLHYK
jgi:hypothetical protein